MYHAILIDKEFYDEKFPYSYPVFNSRKSSLGDIIGIEITDEMIDGAIMNIQMAMRSDKPWYVHCYQDNQLIVIFKYKIFHVSTDTSTWLPVIEYGKSLGIPEEQLDFKPRSIDEEAEYFFRVTYG